MATYTPVLTYTFRDTLGNTDPNKVIKGAYLDGEFSAIHTASLDAASLAGNNSFLGNNTFATTIAVTGDVTATGTVKASGGTFAGVGASSVALIAASNTAAVYFVDASQPTDSKFWPVFTSSSNFVIGATNDADTVTRVALSATRTGNAISAIALGNTTDKPSITLNGPVSIPAPASGFALNAAGNGFFSSGISPGVGSPGVSVAFRGAVPVVDLVNTAAAANARTWSLIGGADGSFTVGPSNDTQTAGIHAFRIAQSAGTPTALQGFGPVAAALVDMTPDKSTFTGTFTGVSGTVTNTCVWSRDGNQVVLTFGTAAGTGTAATYTMTGLPAAIQPARTQLLAVPDGGFQNGVIVSPLNGAVQVTNSGTVTFFIGGVNNGWSAASTKSIINQFSVTYLLN